MRKLLFILITLISVRSVAQEFNCQVSVLAPQVVNSDPRIWKSLETTITQFMNERRFTNYNYGSNERLDLNLLLTINERPAADRFSGQLQVTYGRPVFGSDYNSAVIDLIDVDLNFQYLENTLLEFTPDRFQNNLTSVLAFYAYYVLGLDGDTFEPLGGQEFYELAQQVVNNAQSSAEPGWKAFENKKNRYWVIDNALHASFRPFRDCLYDYHRQGFDTMSSDMVEGRKTVAASIQKLKKVHQIKPASYNLQVFFNAKSDELVDLFSQAAPQEKAQVFNTLQIIDPGNLSKYQKMMRGN